MAKGAGLQQQGQQNLPADVTQLIEQLERHCLAPDGSMVSKSAYYDLQLAREEMSRERVRYLEAMAIYCEAIAMVEEYQQAVSVASLGGIRDFQGLYPQLGLRSSPQVYESLEHRLVIAEAAQRLRLPLISKDGEIHEEEIEKWSIMSRTSLDSTSTSVTISSSSNSTNYANSLSNSISGVTGNAQSLNTTDPVEPGIGGVPNRFLGITPAYLWQSQLHQTSSTMDMTEYQKPLAREVETRLKAKCDKLVDAFVMDNIDSLPSNQISTAWLPERVKLIIEEIEREEAALQEDLYSADRKFAEYYNVLEQILAVLIKLVKDLKLQHQHKYDELQKTWHCKKCETMKAKLRVLEHIFLVETYTQDSIPALHKIRNYLLEATEEASIAYNKAVSRLREYQGVDPHFDMIARQYHDVVKKLENMQWTIHQVEMDLKRLPDNSKLRNLEKDLLLNLNTIYALLSYGSAKPKQNRVDSLIDRMSKIGKKAHGVCEHVKMGRKISETVKGKLSLGSRILQLGGVEKVFERLFSVSEGEKLLNAFQCYLSTTAGPIAGLLFVSDQKVAFCSEKSLTFPSPSGKLIRTPYKVLIPLRKIKRASQSENVNKPAQKYIEIVTVDNFDFWFMGFVSYEKALKHLQQVVSSF